MSPLKFSSAASRSIEGSFLSAPGYQPFAYARRREPSFDFLSNGYGLFLSPLEVGGDFSLVPQVVRDHRVNVRQGYGGVLLRNLLGGRTSVERRDNGVQRHTRTGDTDDAVGVSVNWNPLNRLGRVHWNRSWFDYTAENPSDRLRIWETVGAACDAVLRCVRRRFEFLDECLRPWSPHSASHVISFFALTSSVVLRHTPGAQPRAARERPVDPLRRRVRLVGCSALLDRTPAVREARHSRATRSATNILSSD